MDEYVTHPKFIEAKALEEKASQLKKEAFNEIRDELAKMPLEERLVYSAFAVCAVCKSGLAYDRYLAEPNGSWRCSRDLLGLNMGIPHPSLPFAFYDIKSENQPSANGQTTRPTGK
jgi:hypothetical protein